jgi:hypothetical protein
MNGCSVVGFWGVLGGFGIAFKEGSDWGLGS